MNWYVNTCDNSAKPMNDTSPASGWGNQLEEWALVFLVSLMLAVAVCQIVLRTFFASGWLWADPLLRHLVLWSGFVGAMSASRYNRHIQIDVLVRLLPPAFGRHLRWFSALFSAGICALLTWIGIQFVLDEKAYGLAAFLEVPSWYLQTIFPLTFAVMSWRFARQAVSAFRRSHTID